MKTLTRCLLLAASLAFGVEAGLACTCAPPESAARELERSAAVFSGKVVEIRRRKRGKDIFGRVEAVLRVEKVWKGDVGTTVSVFTSSQSSACGFGFKEGRTYLVYAYGSAGGRLATSICSRTRSLKDAREDLDELGTGRRVSREVRRRARGVATPRGPTTARALRPSAESFMNVERGRG